MGGGPWVPSMCMKWSSKEYKMDRPGMTGGYISGGENVVPYA